MHRVKFHHGIFKQKFSAFAAPSHFPKLLSPHFQDCTSAPTATKQSSVHTAFSTPQLSKIQSFVKS